MTHADTLLKMKNELEEAKSKKQRLEGQLSTMMDTLKQKFGVNTLEEATTLLQEKQKNLQSLEADLTKGIEDLKKAYDWKTI